MKKLNAIILSLIIAFSVCTVAASAAENGEYVHWATDVYGAYIMRLDGKIGIGKDVALTSKNPDYNSGLYYELEVPEDGCYTVTCGAEEYHISEIYAYSDYYDTDMACGYEEYALNDDGSRIYYLTKGTLLLGIENNFDGDIKETGAIITIEKYEGERPEVTYDACDYIENIIISDLEYCLVSYEYYDGTYSFADPRENGKKIEVVFKDGNKEELSSYKNDIGWNTFVELPNGEEFEVLIYQHVTNDGDVYFKVSADEYLFVSTVCDIVTDDRKANTEYLKENISKAVSRLSDAAESFFLTFKYNEGIEDLFDGLTYSAHSIGFWIRDIIDNVSGYIKFCF